MQKNLKQASLNMSESSSFQSERLNMQFRQVTVSQQCRVQGHSMLPLPTFGTSTNYLVTRTSQSYIQSACRGTIACCWQPVWSVLPGFSLVLRTPESPPAPSTKKMLDLQSRVTALYVIISGSKWGVAIKSSINCMAILHSPDFSAALMAEL